MTRQETYAQLKEYAFGLGASLFGVASLKRLKCPLIDINQKTLSGLGYAISLAVRLSDKIIEDIEDHPTKLYFYHYRQINYFLDRIAISVVNFIQERGFRALPVPSSQTIDWKRQIGHLSHREVAIQAGLGWRGRNNLLVTEKFGSRVRLVTILTDFPLPCDEPLNKDCSGCKDCLSICPAAAIKEKSVDFDWEKCFRQLDIFRKQYNIGHHICGICIKACKGKR